MSKEKDITEVDSFAFQSCVAVVVQFVAAGLFFAALLLVFSFFQTGIRAEYTRFMGLNAIIVLTVAGLLKASWLYVRYRIYRHKNRDTLT